MRQMLSSWLTLPFRLWGASMYYSVHFTMNGILLMTENCMEASECVQCCIVTLHYLVYVWITLVTFQWRQNKSCYDWWYFDESVLKVQSFTLNIMFCLTTSLTLLFLLLLLLLLLIDSKCLVAKGDNRPICLQLVYQR